MSCFGKLICGTSSPHKAFKVQDCGRHRRVGIVAKSLNELRKKSSQKFNVSARSVTLVLEEDGTEVEDDEFLQQLPTQTVLVLLTEGQSWQGRHELLQKALSLLLDPCHWNSITSQINDLVAKDCGAQQLHLLGSLGASVNMNIKADTREEDPAWFQDLAPKFKNKEAVMKEKARSRVRGYYYHAKDFVSNNKTVKGRSRQVLSQCLDEFYQRLKEDDYYSDYFARQTGDDKLRYCDRDGWFSCLGKFDEASCQVGAAHMINPYGNKESRVLFSTWELDHRIEKSREVLPVLVTAAAKVPSGHRVHWEYFHTLLFTRQNLKLVHPVCHDKGQHLSAKCDHKQLHVKKK